MTNIIFRECKHCGFTSVGNEVKECYKCHRPLPKKRKLTKKKKNMDKILRRLVNRETNML